MPCPGSSAWTSRGGCGRTIQDPICRIDPAHHAFYLPEQKPGGRPQVMTVIKCLEPSAGNFQSREDCGIKNGITPIDSAPLRLLRVPGSASEQRPEHNPFPGMRPLMTPSAPRSGDLFYKGPDVEPIRVERQGDPHHRRPVRDSPSQERGEHGPGFRRKDRARSQRE